MQLEVKEELSQHLRAAVRAEMEPLFDDLRRFVDRRVAELSAEVHAGVQLADMSEEKLSRELGQVHQQIARLVAIPAATTRNSGVELEAVVQATEAAANTIMEATEAIQDWILSGRQDPESLHALTQKVNSIFEACSFQDVTGQRIRRAIQHLQQVESMLESIMPHASGTAVDDKLQVKSLMYTVAEEARTGQDLAQDDIDALMNG
jgi:chemotaxis protein CheZ